MGKNFDLKGSYIQGSISRIGASLEVDWRVSKLEKHVWKKNSRFSENSIFKLFQWEKKHESSVQERNKSHLVSGRRSRGRGLLRGGAPRWDVAFHPGCLGDLARLGTVCSHTAAHLRSRRKTNDVYRFVRYCWWSVCWGFPRLLLSSVICWGSGPRSHAYG